MNKQEIYDKVKTHLLTQMAKSFDGENCQYRSPNGLRCAIGCLIPDELYDVEIEGRIASELPLEFRSEIFGCHPSESDEQFLDEIQSVHDQYDPLEWKGMLVRVASAYDLTP